MRFLRGILILMLILVALAGGVCWWGWSQWTAMAPSSSDQAALLNISRGMTLRAAADTLETRGLIRDARVLLLGARLTGRDRELRAGLYHLEPGLAPRDLLDNLTSGSTVQIKVTLAEGLDARQMADILGPALGFSADRFLAMADSMVRERVVAANILPPGLSRARLDSLLGLPAGGIPRIFHWCEGYLAPDTYLFGAGAGPLTVADHLISTQMARIDSALVLAGTESRAFASGHQLLVLASIVESEARRGEERTSIASVYTNRLRRGWRLEADPTVAYILEKRGKRMFFKDLEVESPFNTYRKRGLPPGPIGNPGLACLLAAASPDSTGYMYFVSDGEGGHIFSRNMQEHQAAVQRFRRLKAAERRRNRG